MNIVVVSPHPDDETLGAGGTLLRQKARGDKIYWINVTNIDEKDGWDKSFAQRRKQQIKSICEYFKFDGFYDLNFEPSSLENVDKREIITEIGKCFNKIQPEWLILPNQGDAHSDHKIVYDSCMVCSKVFRYPYIKRITTMEIISETDFGDIDKTFVPTYFVDISEQLEGKLKALEIYDTEMGEAPFPRNFEAIKALATLRGGMCGTTYAEAFRIIKWIDK